MEQLELQFPIEGVVHVGLVLFHPDVDVQIATLEDTVAIPYTTELECDRVIDWAERHGLDWVAPARYDGTVSDYNKSNANKLNPEGDSP